MGKDIKPDDCTKEELIKFINTYCQRSLSRFTENMLDIRWNLLMDKAIAKLDKMTKEKDIRKKMKLYAEHLELEKKADEVDVELTALRERRWNSG